MSSLYYRLYRVDSGGRYYDATDFAADDDAGAVMHAVRQFPGERCEVWSRERLVASLSLRLRQA